MWYKEWCESLFASRIGLEPDRSYLELSHFSWSGRNPEVLSLHPTQAFEKVKHALATWCMIQRIGWETIGSSDWLGTQSILPRVVPVSGSRRNPEVLSIHPTQGFDKDKHAWSTCCVIQRMGWEPIWSSDWLGTQSISPRMDQFQWMPQSPIDGFVAPNPGFWKGQTCLVYLLRDTKNGVRAYWVLRLARNPIDLT